MIPMSDRDFDCAVEEALAGIPADFRRFLDNVVIEILDQPAPEHAAEFETDDAPLLGLYVGTPLEDQGPDYDGLLPDRVLIFRRPLTEMCSTREELLREIRITVLHEIGHHFGLDEGRLEELGYE